MDLRVSFHFPPGVKPDETKWHKKEFDSHSLDDDDRIVFTWANSSASPSTQYTYGVSFPKKYVDAKSIVKRTARRRNWGRAIERGMPVFFGMFSVLLTFGIMAAAALSQKRRLMKYLPPSLAIEGVGIKRGLTAVEAGVILEKPLDKVCTMILFGLLKKEKIRVTKEKPLRLEVVEKAGKGLHEYETAFLAAVDKKGRISESKLRKMVVGLIKHTNQKMKGFSRKDTREYYRSIIEKAWKQVSESKAQEIASQVLDRELQWLLMDPRYGERFSKALGDTSVTFPIWYPWHAGVGRGARTAGPAGTGPISVPALPGSDFANSVVSSVESFAHGLVSKVESFTAGITKTTNPPASGSWSGSSGSGCACACACAGCACACAGGGR